MDQPAPFPPCNPFWHDLVRDWLRALPCGEAFPTRDDLWWGAVLGTLCQIASGGGSDQRWEGQTYAVDYMGGDLATITFAGEQVIGLFFAHGDERSPWPPDRPPYDVRPYLAGMPPHLLALARAKALPSIAVPTDGGELQYPAVPDPLNRPVRQDDRGQWLAVITAACWGEGNALSAAETWPELFEHGGYQLRTQLMEPDMALADWQSRLGFSPAQVKLVRDLYERCRARDKSELRLTRAEWQTLERDAREEHEAWLRGTGWTPAPGRDYDAERFEWARAMLASIGIELG
jgi:hypothetical protein